MKADEIINQFKLLNDATKENIKVLTKMPKRHLIQCDMEVYLEEEATTKQQLCNIINEFRKNNPKTLKEKIKSQLRLLRIKFN